ncbi:MAG: hypothetical protein M3Z35_14800 [Nitrospirota bacterium]|nr:hypothetical protein [Nitrospirota bacterium]
MKSRISMIIVLAVLVMVSLLSTTLHGSESSGTHVSRVFWDGFLFAIPVALVGFLMAKARWALMAAVMYGTIGLALDISTVVQELTKADGHPTVLVLSGITGVLNFLLIAIGGRGFLDVLQPASPPAGRAPNPQSPSSNP